MEANQEIDVQALWVEYEKIAMHFNDLLMRLRTQSLAAIAAISAAVGIFAKGDASPNAHLDWTAAEAIFGAMIAFWIAIWCLDMIYYNRLLSGAVTAILKLEEKTKSGSTFDGEINMSSHIDGQFQKHIWDIRNPRYYGVVAFYGIVFAVLVAGFFFARCRA